jgi:hypothetical protein
MANESNSEHPPADLAERPILVIAFTPTLGLQGCWRALTYTMCIQPEMASDPALSD